MIVFMWTPGPMEIALILIVVLIVFGPKRLPDLGRSLGGGIREFKDSVTGAEPESNSASAEKRAS
jgi:sec-independent protein translocase protein TatA